MTNVDLLALDVEGRELEVLRGLDLARHAPRYMLIETLDREKQQPELDRLLDSHYEVAELLSPWDVLYRRRD